MESLGSVMGESLWRYDNITPERVTSAHAYAAAGRLVKEGDKMYSYGWLDKIVNVQENGTMVAAFDYHINGQIASATYADKTENFLWDGLALIHRAGTNYINEPYITGGNPILSSKGDVMFNDLLGTTLAVKSGEQVNQVNMTAFGEPTTSQPNNSTIETGDAGFFTGKPHIGELGYAFLFRNYRPEQGKWQTADPLGYPDGWNNLAYVNNEVISFIDWLGAAGIRTDYRPLNMVGGSVALHSTRHFTLNQSEYDTLSQNNQNLPWIPTTDGNGNPRYDLTVGGHESNLNHLELRYNDPTDVPSVMTETRVTELNAGVSEMNFINAFLDASRAFRAALVEYDGLPDIYGNADTGNCNSLQGNLESIAGGHTTNVPSQAYGWNHIMNRNYFE